MTVWEKLTSVDYTVDGLGQYADEVIAHYRHKGEGST